LAGNMASKKSKVKIYRAGKAPDYAKDGESKKNQRRDKKRSSRKQRHSEEPKIDKRLARLQRAQANEDGGGGRSRRHVEAEVIVEEDLNEEQPKPQQTEDLIQENQATEAWDAGSDRAAIRARLLAEAEKEEIPQQQEEGVTTTLHVDDDEDESEGEESSSEYTSDSDEDDFISENTLIMPKFVPKDKRHTLVERDEEIEKQEQLKELQVQRDQEKRARTLNFVKDQLEIEHAAEAAALEENDLDDIDDAVDDEEADPEREYELWKIRELKRIKRDREERLAWERERADIERRRKMTDEEVMRENKKDPTKNKKATEMKFLQKYYHKGAFFGDELKVIEKTHDWTAPTGEDKSLDRRILPNVMQVKNFGRASRSKYTHLTDQDTTFKEGDSAWNQRSEFSNSYASKMGGMKKNFDRPSKRPRYRR